MKRSIIILILVLIMIIQPAMAGVGNNLPSGPHFNLNIIGMSNDKENMVDQSGGHVIFVPLESKVKILLQPGDFAVIDKNATDDGVATFQLPDPYDGVIPDEDDEEPVFSSYSVYARAMGKPGGDALMQLIAEMLVEVDGIEQLIQVEGDLIPLTRKNGSPVTTNVTKDLLFLTIDGKRYDLFDNIFEDVFWSYDNHGLKIVQLRFYPNVQTQVF